jgi:hypothetical protein
MRAAHITAFSKRLENLRVENVPDPVGMEDPGGLGLHKAKIISYGQ